MDPARASFMAMARVCHGHRTPLEPSSWTRVVYDNESMVSSLM
jgi:hypothetical protein